MDNQIGRKIEEGRGQDIIHAFTEENYKNLYLPDGLVGALSNIPKDMQLPGTDVLTKHVNISLDSAVTHKG